MKKLCALISALILLTGCQTGGANGSSAASGKSSSGSKEPLSDEQINSIIKDSELGFYPITTNGVPDKILSDINQDGIDDILVLFVRADSADSTEHSDLSSKSRIFDDNEKAPEFSLIAFANYGTDLTKQSTILLGSYKAISDVKLISQKESPEDPLIVSVSFADSSRQTTKLISFKSFDLTSLLDLKRDNTSGFYLKDVNRDRIPDIIKHEKMLMDDGSHDTVLSLYSWDGNRFSFREGRQVVKELRLFLNTIKSHVEADDRESLIKTAFSPLEARRLLGQHLDTGSILKIIFKPADKQSRGIRTPKEILFAEIQENPFTLQNRSQEHQFQIFCRMIFGNLSSDFYKATIVLNENPFSNQLYYFTY